ncbi:MAG: sodium:solute symporter [Eubacteriales bacterium]|nr:sodium:solute symporter [Clostridiales bacterium]MDY3286741.1 sodium:solute symporter [Eubacteriales bacterium]
MTTTIAGIALSIFAVCMIGIGIYGTRRTRTVNNFLLGGRKIGPWLSAFSYGTAYFSAVVFVGYAGMHGWNIGLASMWIGVGNALIGCYMAWKLLAVRTRQMTHNLEARTMPEFFASRYENRGMKLFAACIIFIFLVPYAASVYKGLGMLFSAVFPGTPDWVCMALVALLTAICLTLGGYVSSTLTDLIQGFIMIAGVIVMVVAFATRPEVGGFTSIVSKLREVNPTLVDPLGGSSFQFLLFNILLTSVGTWGLPQMVHKFYAIRDEHSIRHATIVSTIFCAVIGCGAYFIGSLSRLFLTATASGTPDIPGSYDAVMPTLLMKVFSGSVVSNIVLSVILLLLLSASMSTLSAIVLTSSSSISVDILKTLRPDISEKRQMITMRSLCVLFVALSFAFACANISFIVNLMSFSWGIVAGSFLGPYVWGLYSKKINRAGAWSGLLSGIVVVGGAIIVISIVSGFAAAKSAAPILGVAAMAVSLIVTPLVSRLFPSAGTVSEDTLQRSFLYIHKK